MFWQYEEKQEKKRKVLPAAVLSLIIFLSIQRQAYTSKRISQYVCYGVFMQHGSAVYNTELSKRVS